MDSPAASFRADLRSPGRWYLAALFPVGIGVFMYALEASEWERLRLYDPVAAAGEFASAECITYRKGLDRERMLITYVFAPGGFAGDTQETPPGSPPAAPFTAKDAIVYPSRAACEAALPAVRAAKAPHPVWFERGQPHLSKTTLEEPDSRRFLWVGLGAIPLALVGGILSLRRRRRSG